LAGLASTKQGNIYFAVVVADGTRGKPGITGRAIIRKQVEDIFRQYGGSDDIGYSVASFFEVDDGAKLQLQSAASAVP
jgi:predicted acetyltransferase